MPFSLLYSLLPDLAERETRSLIVRPGVKSPLPADEFFFCEMFCDEPGCDCRRVFFSVASERQRDILAVIAYGWETPEFYARWMRDDDPVMVADLIGPILNPDSPQSPLAWDLLDLFTAHLLPDAAYIDRIKRHYQLFRELIDAPKGRHAPMRIPAPTTAKIPPNARCPCGSGQKYKRCCGAQPPR